MKKNLLQLVIFLCILNSSIFATNYQKVQDINSDVDEAISSLLISQGKTPGGETLPYSNAELISMLDRININSLNQNEIEIYNYISEIANEEPNRTAKGMGITFSGAADLELYVHSNTDSSNVGRSNWIRGWNDMEPTLKLNLETWPSNNFYGFGEISFGNSIYVSEDKCETSNLTDFGHTTLSTNILMLSDITTPCISDLDFGIPYRAFVAMGGDNWSFQTGREQLSWGNGVSGNMTIGDQVTYHNMARYSAYSDIYKYTFLTSFFPHPSLYYDYDSTNVGSNQTLNKFNGQGQDNNGLKMYMAHRLEFNIFETLNITVTESIMYQSISNTFDLRILNPVAIYHDYYIKNNANSLLTFEMNYTPIKHINVYGQLAVDEFALPGEPTSGSSYNPQALGLMLGVKGIYPIKGGFAYASIEGVKTDPYLYIRNGETVDTISIESGVASNTTEEYDINYVVAVRNWSDSSSYDEYFIGYEYGGDALVLNLNGGFKKLGKYSIEGNIFYMAHGTFDKWTVWETADTSSTPTSSNDNENKNSDMLGKNAVEHTLVLGVNGNYELNSKTNTYAQLDYVYKTNSGNIKDVTYNDVQLTVGAKYKF
jgi:hypothetical protein